MLKTRMEGLVALQAALLLLLLPVWFLLQAYVAVEWLGRLNYGQINFPLYLFGIAAAALISFGYQEKSYPRGSNTQLWVQAVRRTNVDVAVLALVLFTIVFATKDKAISRLFLSTHIVTTWAVLLVLNRHLPHRLSELVFSGRNRLNTVLVGGIGATRNLRHWAVDQASLGMNVLGLVTDDEDDDDDARAGATPVAATEADAGIPILGRVSELEDVLDRHGVDQVVLLETRGSKAWVRGVVDSCNRMGCRFLILNPWGEYFDRPLRVTSLGEHTFFTLREEPLQNPFNRVVKRTFDLALALPVVVLILPPLCLLVALFQAAQAPGPLFFKQVRTGRGRAEFTIFKFRSMYEHPADLEAEAQQARRGDGRVYPFGRFLRRTSLDEFPQFFNVLRGEMSVVGPRPHLSRHDDAFARVVDVYRTRSFVKPGITGYAQCKGYRGEISDPQRLRQRIDLDLEYIHNWSIWWDIGLVLQTARVVVNPPQTAY